MESIDLEDVNSQEESNPPPPPQTKLSAVQKYKPHIAIGSITLTALIAFLIGFFVIRSQTKEVVIDPYARLPLDPNPINYNLTFIFDFANKSFHGRSVTKVQVKSSTKYLFLNTQDLYNISASIRGPFSQDNIKIDSLRRDVTRLTTLADIPTGTYDLVIDYEGVLTDDSLGIRYERYPDGINVQFEYYITTQFHTSGARNAFPCWDEPLFKATYDLTIIAPSSQTVLSSMPQISKRKIDNTSNSEFKFYRTPAMSSYSFAFAIGEFNSLQTNDILNVSHRMFMPKGLTEGGNHALQISSESLIWLTAYLRMFYPLPSLDMLGVKEFEEDNRNWGLSVYDSRLLQTTSESALFSRMNLVNSMCRKNAQMWFGGLVSMDWWDHEWIVNGITEYLALKCSQQIPSSVDPQSMIILSVTKPALLLDSLTNAKPLNFTVSEVNDSPPISNVVVFAKSTAIVRTMAITISPIAFRNSLQILLLQNAFNTISPAKLYEVIEKVTGQNIIDNISKWTKMSGFPIISITIGIDIDSGDKSVILSQERYLSDGQQAAESNPWTLTIEFIDDQTPLVPKWKANDRLGWCLIDICVSHWIKANPGKSEFIVVQYDPQSLQRLYHGIVTETLGPADRLDVELDQFLLAKAGHQQMSDFLEFLRIFRPSLDYYVWQDISDNVNYVNAFRDDMEIGPGLDGFAKDLYEPLVDYLGWPPGPQEDDDETTGYLRPLIISQAGAFGNAKIVNEALGLLNSAVTNPAFDMRMREAFRKYTNNEPPNNASRSYQPILTYYEKFINVPEARIVALRSLGYVKNASLIEHVANYTLFSKKVGKNEARFVFESLGTNIDGRETGWSFIKTMLPDINTIFDSSDIISEIIEPILSKSADPQLVGEVVPIFQTIRIDPESFPALQIIDQIKTNVAYVSRSKSDLQEYLKRWA